MNKRIKFIVLGLITIVVCYLAYFVFISSKYRYRIDMENYKQYQWIFNESVLDKVDTTVFVWCVRERDILYNYIYKKDYYITIWEFKDLEKTRLKDISINQNVDLSNLKFKSGQVLNKRGSPEFTVRFVSFFKDSMNINIDRYSKIEEEFDGLNYKGFYGAINKVSLSNENSKDLAYIEFPNGKETSLFLLHKKHQSFFVIIIHSEKPFDKSIINILNLR